MKNFPCFDSREIQAYFMENSFGRYFMTQKTKCKLYLHPTNLPLSQYGLVLRKGSPLTQEISEVIIKLRERGILNVFYKRWIDSTCERQKWGKTEKLHLHFFKKVFLVLVSAVFLSVIIIILEFWYQKMSKKYGAKILDSKQWSFEIVNEDLAIMKLGTFAIWNWNWFNTDVLTIELASSHGSRIGTYLIKREAL